ncbi:MAG: hypothetical protein PHV75_09200 [Victivallaceae bacterium]|jgi:cobalamin synthase|nr:hypothetical protein [Victivallaceae bacterium]MDD3704338.1 hypothetical protein [Victivallaceae bacterium]MDD4318677.1 hypothetical protein [Victivallaceae bacterium]MDD5664347.1 hypothetical protein [Victivallaceae bacterium]NLK83434.1 hypothetical protein [Lentisphaerota bacterium]
MKLEEYMKYFCTAWELLIDLPLPKILKKSGTDDDYGIEVQYSFPLVGLLLGIMVLIVGFLLSFLNSFAAALIFAVPMAILVIAKDSGRSIGSLISFIELKAENVSTITALYNMKSDIRNIQSLSAVISIVTTMLFYLLVFFLMSLNHFYYWMIPVMVLSFTLQGTLATLPLLHNEKPLITVPRLAQNQIWLIAGFIVLFVLIKTPYATLITAALAFLAARLLRRYLLSNLGGISTHIIGFAGFVFEIAALLIGIIFMAV